MRSMKVQRSMWDFAPRRLSAPPATTPLDPPTPEERKLEQLRQLRAEHPWMSRSVEVLQMGAWVAHDQSRLAPWSQASAGLSGLTAVASAAWGFNKLARAQSGLDRIEGLGHLALAVEYSRAAAEQLRPDWKWTGAVAGPANYMAAGCELLLGGVDLVRGLREDDKPRLWTGLAGMAAGAAYAASMLVPGANGMAQAAVLGSLAVRQAVLGADG